MTNFKPGGGNKPQPFIPKGNGEKSGEYTNKFHDKQISNCFIEEKEGRFNFLKSKLVGKVYSIKLYNQKQTISIFGKPYSVAKKIRDGYIITERYYNDIGRPYLDIDYNDHGNSGKHPVVPHIHHWYRDSKTTIPQRGKWEDFK